MINPNIEFLLNERCLDLDVYYTLMFFRNPDKLGDFSKKIRVMKQFPQLERFDELNVQNQELFIRQEIEKLHANLHAELVDALMKARSSWKKLEKDYFDLVAKVFHNFLWPKGDYKCYMSVIDINAIIKKEKSFQLFYGMVSKNITNAVIAHEMLHFIFYSYMEKYSDIEKVRLWEMAEIFNKFIQNSKKFKDFNYPEDKVLDEKQEAVLKDIRTNLDSETADIHDFVSYYLKEF